MLRSAIGFVVGFIVLGATGIIGFNLYGNSILQAAGWQPGMMPPARYVWSMLATDFAGSILAGALMTFIAGRHFPKAALALILAVAAIRAYQYVSALDSNPHWYALVMVFLPAAGLPAGSLLLRRFIGERVQAPSG